MVSSTSLLLALGSIAAVSAQEWPTEYSNPLGAKVFLYTYCDGFRHDSIPTAMKQLQAWGPYYNITFDATEDQAKFPTDLSQYDAVMFVHSTGNIFTAAGQTAFTDYINKGGNFAAIHAASAAYMEKPWAPWTQTLGATFDHHPARQNATFVKEMTGHPATDFSPDRWLIEEEVYSFTSDPRKLGAKLLWSVDPSSYKENNVVAAQGDPHPIGWYQDYAAGAVIKPGVGAGVAGRSFYSSLGHLNETWMDATFMKHVLGGLTWTFGSNTTRVAQGLYNGATPTVHTGASNNSTGSGVNSWNPVLGSNAVATNVPPRPTATSTGATPDATAAGTTGNTSGALMLGVSPSALWAVTAAALGVVFGSAL